MPAAVAVDVELVQPISRTYQYRKVMKPMLERKRRARINHCLDELKDFILTALQTEGENVTKLEKADILEWTVQYLRKIRNNRAPNSNVAAAAAASSAAPVVAPTNDRFRDGYIHCANEVSRCLAATPGINMNLGTKLMAHLGGRLNGMDRCPSSITSPQMPSPAPSSSGTSPLLVRVPNNNNNSATPSEGYGSAPSSPCSVSSIDSYQLPMTPDSMCSSSGSSSYGGRALHQNGVPPPLYRPEPIHPLEMSSKVVTAMPQSSPVWRPW